jgi:hypothetical protein
LTTAELGTLLVAHVVMDAQSDGRFAKRARKQLAHPFPGADRPVWLHKRRVGLADAIEQMMGALAGECPGFWDDVVLRKGALHTSGRSSHSMSAARVYSRLNVRVRAVATILVDLDREVGLLLAVGMTPATTRPNRGEHTDVQMAAARDRRARLRRDSERGRLYGSPAPAR